MNPTAVVRPLPGPGLAVRAGDLLLVCGDADTGVEELLGLVAEVAAAGGDGSVLVRRVAALLANDFEGSFPACAVSGPTPDGRLAVLVYGVATADIVGGDGDVSLSGVDAITSVNRLVAGPITAIRLQLPGAGTADPRSRLDAGVVSAAGVLLSNPAGRTVPAQAAAPPMMAEPAMPEPMVPEPMVPEPMVAEPMVAEPVAPELIAPEPMVAEPVAKPFTMDPPIPPPPPPPPPPVEAPPVPMPPPMPQQPSMPLPMPPVPTAEADPGQFRQPDPSAPFVAVLLTPGGDGEAEESPAPVVALDMRPRVLGVQCKNDHFNDPNLRYCSVCGISMAQQTLVQHEGPRPPLGVLLLDDGSTFRLDVDYVVGREPQQDPEVVAGTVRPLRITDADGVVSRRHARVALVGWDVHVVDLGSANGTFVQLPGDPQRHQLVANQPVVVRPGTQVTLGRRWFRYESHRNP